MNNSIIALLSLMYFTPAAVSVYHILLYKRDNRAALGWIMACVFIPYGGPVAYFLFGINRIRTRARVMKRRLFNVDFEAHKSAVRQFNSDEKGLPAVGYRVTGRLLSSGNSIEIYHNGEMAYPAMLAAIRGATNRIVLTTYILKSDDTGKEFMEALRDAVTRGVEVFVLIDGIGEFYAWPRPSRRLRKYGIETARFLPPKLLPPSIHLNMRNHRKLLVVDELLAFAGGMNISDDHRSSPDTPRLVTDVHFALKGHVAADLARVFEDDWYFTTRRKLNWQSDLPEAIYGGAKCRVIPDGPDEELDALALTIQGVIAAAKDTVDIMTPYFLPARELISSLQSAALRGVRVRVVLPAKNNLLYVHWANRNTLAELINWNIEIYYQPAPFCHSKLLCVDNEYSMIGSANLDPRSLRLNFEVGVEIFCVDVRAQLQAHFEAVVVSSSRVTSKLLLNRSVPVRLRDSFVGLFSPYL